VSKFTEDVREFYDAKDRERGSIIAEDRFGEQREFKLLSVSVVVAHVGMETTVRSAEQLNHLFALEKKEAKKALNHIAIINI
jgi:hypothetical protein